MEKRKGEHHSIQLRGNHTAYAIQYNETQNKTTKRAQIQTT